jgi:pyridoxamine 5'-phosphate oxidase-like protein
MPRERIAMTDEEVRAFLGARHRLVLTTLGPEGAPSGEVHRYVLEDDDLVFSLPQDAGSLANLRRDARACAIVEHFPRYYAIKGVAVHGRVRLDESAARLPLDDVVSFDFSKIRGRA